MMIIGERINSTRKSIDKAVRNRDRDAILTEAQKQVEAGASYLDVNCGSLNTTEEPEALKWLVKTVQGALHSPLCIDSPNPEALAAALEVHQGEAIINSISGESERFKKVLPLALKHKSRLVALCLDDHGIPKNRQDALDVGVRLIDSLLDAGISPDRIYLDPLARSVATSPGAVLDTLAVMSSLREKYESLHFVSGLSNVSYGLPERRHLNRAYVVMSVANGLDSVIMDPLDNLMQALIYASEALVNRDKFCLNYIKAFNQGKLKD